MDSKKIKTSIICPDEKCFICGTNIGLHLHHCMSGSNRKRADQDKLFVALCMYHHSRLHDFGEHEQELKALAQRSFIRAKIEEGYTEGKARGLWLNRYQKFYDY